MSSTPPGREGRFISIAGLLLTVTLGVFFGSLSYTMYHARAASYLSDDPTACVNCHIMRDAYDSWQKAGHHTAANCNDCHVPHDLVGKYLTKLDNGYHHSVAFTLDNFHEPIRARDSSRRVVLDNCLDCHVDLVSEMSASAGASGEPIDCIHCHAAAGHGPPR